MTSRSWPMWANDYGEDAQVRFRHFGAEHWLRMCHNRAPIVPVVLTEDTAGSFLGWLKTGATELSPIGSDTYFKMLFQNDPAEEERHGRGVAVRVRVELDTSTEARA